MAKFKLDLEPDPEVSVFGISSHVHDHRLCWSLNKALDLRLQRCRADILEEQAGRTTAFAVFEYYHKELKANYRIIGNHGTDGVLISEHRQADFFLVVDEVVTDRDPDLLQHLRDVEFVLTAFSLPFASLRKGHLLLQAPE